jgi:hypothetical protein
MKYMSAMMKNKARFIQMVSDGQVNLIGGRMSKDETNAVLRQHDFKTMEELNVLRKDNLLQRKDSDDDADDDEIIEEDISAVSSPFDYLLKMPLASLTTERTATLMNEAFKQEAQLKNIMNTEPEEIWLMELEKLSHHL